MVLIINEFGLMMTGFLQEIKNSLTSPGSAAFGSFDRE